MAQLTLYVPDEVAARLRLKAKRAGKSLSAYVVSLAAPEDGLGSAADAMRAGFGRWRGKVPRNEDPPADEVESW